MHHTVEEARQEGVLPLVLVVVGQLDIDFGQLGALILSIFVHAHYLQKSQSFRLFPLDVKVSVQAKFRAKSFVKTRFVNVKVKLIFSLFGSRLFYGRFW